MKKKDKITFFCPKYGKSIDINVILYDYELYGENYCKNLYSQKVINCIKELPIFKNKYDNYYIDLLTHEQNQIKVIN